MSEEEMQDVEEAMEEEAVQEEETDTSAEIREAFDIGASEEKGEDDIKMAMIGAGATFKNVTRFYNKFMIDAGFAISKEDRNALVEGALEGEEFADENDFASCVSLITEAVQGATERSAGALIRSYAKKNELDCYVKPKGESTGRTGFAGLFYDALVVSPAMSKEAAVAFIQGAGDNAETSENTKRHENHFLRIAEMANRIAESFAPKAA